MPSPSTKPMTATPTKSDSVCVLYEHPLSPYAQKVKLALLEKEIEFTTPQFGALSDSERELFEHYSPRGEVPLLVHGETAIFDSSIILQYIEECWPEPSLLPATAAERATVRMLEESMDTHFEANTWGLSEVINFRRADGALAAALNRFAEQEIEQWFRWLDAQLGTREWFNGERFGWGDLCVVPFVNGALGFGIEPTAGTHLDAWLARANTRPSVKTSQAQALGAALDPEMMTAALAAGFKREYRDHRVEWMIRAGALAIVAEGINDDNIRFSTPFTSE